MRRPEIASRLLDLPVDPGRPALGPRSPSDGSDGVEATFRLSEAVGGRGRPPARRERYPFRIVLADPPWRAENRSVKSSPDHVLVDDRLGDGGYRTMTLRDICALPVDRLVGRDALLALWAPWIFAVGPEDLGPGRGYAATPPAVRVALSWGFVPFTAVPWLKGRLVDGVRPGVRLQIGIGWTVRVATELLILCKRGRFSVPSELRPPGLLAGETLGILAPRSRHSAKPLDAYALLDRIADGAARVELFARDRREGWAAWGDEVECDPFAACVLGEPR